jgi:DNA modification methylase
MTDHHTDTEHGDNWTAMLGDSCERLAELPADSVDLSVYSPPFAALYTYSPDDRDLGNCANVDQFIDHYAFIVAELLRVTKPGRIVAVHCAQLPSLKWRDGFVGLQDFRGDLIRAHIAGGWQFHGEVTIDKNPQIQATRNKERGLLFKTLATDSSLMRMALADYLLYFRKPGDNPVPIHAGISEKYNRGGGWITEEEWIEWAAPVWYRQTKNYPGGIRETDVLNVSCAREDKDERHLCPLQLGVIERCVKLWSAPGDTVLSPFMGIGSEGYMSIKHGRKFVGFELKESYYNVAVRNLNDAVRIVNDKTMDLFSVYDQPDNFDSDVE